MPLLSREPMDLESNVAALESSYKTHLRHQNELKIEVMCEIMVRSQAKIRRYNVLGPGDRD